MPRQSERDRGVAYPQLDREDINLIIGQLMFAIRNRDLGADLDRAESAVAYLTGFYTRRWGLPPAIRRLTETAAAARASRG